MTLKGITLKQSLPYIMIAAGVVGLLASLMLTHDKIQVLQNPDYDPFCNINPIFSCRSVMVTEQASLLGLPNTVFGVIGFTALVTLGFLLAAGAQIKRWLWLVVQLSATVGVIFMHYLFFQAVYRINAICLWCFATWIVVIPVFWYITLYNLREGHIRLKNDKIATFLQKHHGNMLLAWYGVIFMILLVEFWYYWETLI